MRTKNEFRNYMMQRKNLCFNDSTGKDSGESDTRDLRRSIKHLMKYRYLFSLGIEVMVKF